MEPQKFSLQKRIRSFHFAWGGISNFFRSEHNAWLHAVSTVLVILLASLLRLTKPELIAIVFCVGFVWVTEMINTAIEKMMDHLSPETHPSVKAIKDIAAGAVLVAAVTSFIIGLIIFIPKII